MAFSRDGYSGGLFTSDWFVAGRMEVSVMEEESCGKPARWMVKGVNYGPVYLCESHHIGSEIARLVKMGLLVMEGVEGDEKVCQRVVRRRKGPEKNPRTHKRVLFG